MISMSRPHPHMPRFRAQPCACASLTSPACPQFGKLLAHRRGVGLLPASLKTREHAFKPAMTLQHRLLQRRLEFLPGFIQAKAKFLRKALQGLEGCGVTPVPTGNGTRCEAQVGKLHHPARVEKALDAQAVATRTGSGWVVEGK